MAKKKKYWYVLVMTEGGPVFVTSVDYSPKVAHWYKTEKPKDFSKEWAEDIAFGLTVNGYTAFAVTTRYELDTQAYFYNKGHFEWKLNEEEEDND